MKNLSRQRDAREEEDMEARALAERCEAATGPDRELADEVLLACGWRLNHDYDDIVEWRTNPGVCEGEDGNDYPVTLADRMNWACWYAPGNRPFRDSWIDGYYRPNPLASIDGALTLVGDDNWRVEDHPMAGPCAVVGDSEGYAGTPALALCAAALRARASSPTRRRNGESE